MKKSRFTDEQIIGFLKQVEGGVPVKDLCRKHGFSDATFYKWRSRLGGLDVSVANSSSGGDRELELAPAVSLPTVVIQFGGRGTKRKGALRWREPRERAPNDIFADLDPESLADLLGDTHAAKVRIATLQRDDGGDEIRGRTLWAWPAARRR